MYFLLFAAILTSGLETPVRGRLLLDFPDYCLEEFRCGRLMNLMCMYRWKRENDICGKIWIETDQQLRQDIFHRVNSYRQILAGGELPKFPQGASNMRQVSWDYELEMMAEAWAFKYIDKIFVGNDFTKPCTKTEKFKDGSSILGYVLGPDEMARDIVAVWTKKTIPPDVIGNFRPDPSNGSEFYDDHATIIWAETHKMGCSIATCNPLRPGASPITVIACLFGPRGNYVGKRVFKNGTACSHCSPGTECKSGSVWPKLCAAEEDRDAMDGPDEPQLTIFKFLAFLLPLGSIVSFVIILAKPKAADQIEGSRKIWAEDGAQGPTVSCHIQNVSSEYKRC